MRKLNDDAIRKIVLQVQEYAEKSGLRSFMEPFDAKPSAWREMAMLVAEDGYTARKLYEALNPSTKDENYFSSPYSAFPRSFQDNSFKVTKKDGKVTEVENTTPRAIQPVHTHIAPWDFVSFDADEDDYCKFAIVKNCYRLFVGLLNSGVKLYV